MFNRYIFLLFRPYYDGIDRKGWSSMDLSKYGSLRACSADEVLHQLRQANKKLEIYAAEIDPELFVNLKLPTFLKADIIMSKQVFTVSDDEFIRLFHRVFYESLQVEINLKEEKRVKYLKGWCLLAIIFFSILFISFRQPQELKLLMFIVVIALCGCLYELFKHKTKIVVSDIKRRTNFKVMADGFLGFLPTVYIVDQQMYIGANLFKYPCSMELYAVESKAEQQQLKSIYEHYVMANRCVQDEFIIGQYFERMHSDELSSMSWQD